MSKFFKVYPKGGKDEEALQVECAKFLPAAWLPKVAKKKRKQKTSPDIPCFFTTEEAAETKNYRFSKRINNFDCEEIGAVYWNADGDKLCVISRQIDLTKWDNMFEKSNNRYLAAATYLEQTENDCKEFSQLPSSELIKLLFVPKRFEKQFKMAEFGFSQLEKYCDFMANRKKNKAKQSQEKLKEAEKREKQLRVERSKKRAAELDDTMGQLDLCDTVYTEVGGVAYLQYEIDRERSEEITNWMMFSTVMSGGTLPRVANDLVETRYEFAKNVGEKINGNDIKKMHKLIDRLATAFDAGIVNRDVLRKILLFYTWRYNNVINLEI